MLTNNEKVAFYGCILKNLVHSAIQSLGNGRTELEGADICLPNGAVSTKDISLYFPVPIVLATNRHIGKRKKLREDLFSLLQAEEHRTSEYTKVVTPYLWSVYGDRNAYRLDKKGFEKVDFEKVFKDSPGVPISEWAEHNGIAIDIYLAVSSAYHQLFTRKFNPDLFRLHPDYASINGKRKGLVNQFIDKLKDENPRETTELEALL